MVDEIWSVSVPFETAKARLIARNGFPAAEAERRIASQLSNEERRAHAEVEIENGGNEATLRARVQEAATALLERHSGLSAGEIVDEVDESNGVVRPVKRALVRGFNLRHRATYVIVRRAGTGEVYVQRRSALKDYCPSHLDPAPGGVLGLHRVEEGGLGGVGGVAHDGAHRVAARQQRADQVPAHVPRGAGDGDHRADAANGQRVRRGGRGSATRVPRGRGRRRGRGRVRGDVVGDA